MRELLLVLNVKAHTFLKSTFVFSPSSFLKGLSSLVIFGGFAVGVFFLARASTIYLIHQAHIGLFLFHRFLSMLLYVFFITVNLGNMIVCYATLYRSEEVTFLMGLPISHEKIFVLKFVDNFFYSSSTLWLLGLAMLLGYGSVFNLPWHFYLLAMFAILLPFMLIAGILAVIVLMGLIRIASRIGIRWLLTLIIALYLGAIYLYFKISNPVQLVSEVMKHYPNVNEYFGYLDPPFVRYLPNHWVSEFLYWTITGDTARAFPHFAVLLLSTLGLMVLAYLLAQRYYYASWLTASDARAVRFSPGRIVRLRLVEFGGRRVFGAQTDAILRRDFLMFFREPSQWLHMLLMLLLLVIFLVSVGTLELKLTQPFLQVVSFLVVFLFDGFLVASVCLRFVFPAVSLEGDAFWSVRSAPLSLRRLYLHKMIFSLALVIPVAELLAVLSNALLRDNWVLVILAAFCAGFAAIGLTGINLGAGAVFANYRERNPIRVASSQGASLTFLASMIYLSVVVSLMIIPLNAYFERLILRGDPGTGWILVPVAVVGAISVSLFALASALGLRAIRRDF